MNTVVQSMPYGRELIRFMLWCSVALLTLGNRCARADESMVIVAGGQPLAQIVVADVPDPLGIMVGYTTWTVDRTRNARYAAEFLQQYIEEVTGAKLPIVPEYFANKWRPLILVGRSKLTSFAEADRRKLAPEGFIIRRQGKMIAIVGEIAPESDLDNYRGADRGTMFGVYEFLERTCGVRWYFPGRLGTVVPKQNTLVVRELNVSSAPQFHMRFGPIRGDNNHPASRQGNVTGFWAVHTADRWYKYAREYPEVFAVMEDGQRNICLDGSGTNKQNHLNYTNPKVLEIELRQIDDFYKNGTDYWGWDLRPNERYVRFFPKDLEKLQPVT